MSAGHKLGAPDNDYQGDKVPAHPCAVSVPAGPGPAGQDKGRTT